MRGGFAPKLATLVIGSVLTASAPSFAACGDNPGDADAVSAARAQVAETCNCSAVAASHSQYVLCAARVARAAEKAGTLSAACGRVVTKCASNSTVGRPGAVPCCTTNSSGVIKASIKSNAAMCKAPLHGSACVAYALSACDACTATGCYIPPSPTPTAVPTPTPVLCPQVQVPLPNLIQVPLTLQNGTTNCGFNPPASPPFSGEIDDVNGVKLADLGLGCQYAPGVPPLSLPGGSTATMNVVGLAGTEIVLGPSSGSGRTDCTRGAGPGTHCLNGAPGTDSAGACTTDADCQIAGTYPAGSCAPDANCFFGSPLDLGGLCLVNTLVTDICGTADLSGNTNIATTISARAYLIGCPHCVNGACDGGANAGQACSGTGASLDCPPSPRAFTIALTVPLSPLTTGTSTLTETGGKFCPGPPPRATPPQPLVCPPTPIIPNAFGFANAGTISETGQGLLSANLLHVSVGATFCIPSTGSFFAKFLGLPAPGALSVTGQIDLTNALPGLQLLGLPPPP